MGVDIEIRDGDLMGRLLFGDRWEARASFGGAAEISGSLDVDHSFRSVLREKESGQGEKRDESFHESLGFWKKTL